MNNKKNILVIEDDTEVCEFYRVLLEHAGYTVHETHSGSEALIVLGIEMPKTNGSASTLLIVPDLIISDIMLPGIDGYTLISKLLQDEKLKNIPVIVVSARTQMSDLFVPLSNVKHIFSKPLEPKSILNKIKELTG